MKTVKMFPIIILSLNIVGLLAVYSTDPFVVKLSLFRPFWKTTDVESIGLVSFGELVVFITIGLSSWNG